MALYYNQWRRQRSKAARSFQVRKSSSQVTRSQGRSQNFSLGAQKLSAEGA